MDKKRCYGCMKLKTSSPICEHCGWDETRQNASHQLAVGTVLREQYMIGRVLGQGGFGITYLGWDLYLDIPVAIKEYYPTGMVMRETGITNDVVSCTGDVGARFQNNKERFLREAKMLARFSQVPEIVQVKNFFLANNTAYIVMEYLEGITLKEYVAKQGGKLTIQETLGILEPMIRTLRRVHKAGIVHRDISPDNIMMLPDGRAKLLDFGAVRDVGAVQAGQSLTKSTEAILKQGYAPIEQYQKRGSLGPWTDVYAMCATIYFCITGQIPPDAPERLLTDEELDLNIPGLEDYQKKALEHGMALRVEQRTGSMDQLYEELTKPAPEPPRPGPVPPGPGPVPPGPGPVPPGPGPVPPRPDPGRKKKIILISCIAVLAVLACILAAVGLSGSKTPSTPGSGPVSELAGKDQSGELGSIRWHLDGKTGHMTLTGTGPTGDFSSPQWNDGHPVAPWHYCRPQIKSLEVGQGITELGSYAFYECENLKTVTLPDGLQRVGWNCFERSPVETVNLPESLRKIDSSAFNETKLSEVTIPAQVQELGTAFQGIKTLKSLTLLGNPRISGDTWNGSVVNFYGEPIPEGFVLKGEGGTAAQAYAEALGLPFEAIRTGSWDEEGTCGTDLQWHLDREAQTLYIDGSGEMENFTSIRNTPWNRLLPNIRFLILGDGVTSVGSHAFEGCGVSDVHFGKSLRRIGESAFALAGMDEIILPVHVQEVGVSAFAGCPWLGNIYFGPRTKLQTRGEYSVLTSEDSPYAAYTMVVYGEPGSEAEKLAQSESVSFQSGESWCVPWMEGYTKKVMAQPRNLEGSCGPNVRWELNQKSQRLRIFGKGPMQDYKCLWWENGIHTAPWTAFHKEIREVIVEEGVTAIGDAAFVQFTSLQKLSLPDSLRTIGRECFFGTELRELELPEGLTEIRGGAFSFSGLTHLVVPSSVKEVENLVSSCYHLQSVTLFPETSVSFRAIWGDEFVNPGPGTRMPENLVIRGAEGSAAHAYAMMLGVPFETTMDGSWDDSGTCSEGINWYVNLKDGILAVDGTGMIPNYDSWKDTPWSQYLGKVRTLVIGNQIPRVGDHAFERSSLENVYIGREVRSIGRYAFANSKIHEPMIPDSVMVLEEAAFAGCQNLWSIYIPRGCELMQEEYTPFTSLQNPQLYRFRMETPEGSPAAAFADAHNLELVTHQGMYRYWD